MNMFHCIVASLFVCADFCHLEHENCVLGIDTLNILFSDFSNANANAIQ